MMTTREVAAYLGVSPVTVTRLKGQLQVACGRGRGSADYFPREAVENFLSRQKIWPPRSGGYPHPVAPRLFSKLVIDQSTGCLLWTGACNDQGYGHLHVGGRTGRQVYVHRLMYELFVDSVPDGLEIDHLCKVPRCASPAHLEAVTHRENILRGESPIARHYRHKRGVA